MISFSERLCAGAPASQTNLPTVSICVDTCSGGGHRSASRPGQLHLSMPRSKHRERLDILEVTTLQLNLRWSAATVSASQSHSPGHNRSLD